MNNKAHNQSNGMPKTRTTLTNPYTNYLVGTKKGITGLQVPLKSNYKPSNMRNGAECKQDLNKQVEMNDETSRNDYVELEPMKVHHMFQSQKAHVKSGKQSKSQTKPSHFATQAQSSKVGQLPSGMQYVSQPRPRMGSGDYRPGYTHLAGPPVSKSPGKIGQINNLNKKSSPMTDQIQNEQKVSRTRKAIIGNEKGRNNDHSIIKILTQNFKQRTSATPQTTMHAKLPQGHHPKHRPGLESISQISYGKPNSNNTFRSPIVPKDKKQLVLKVLQPPQSTCSKIQNIKNLDSKNHFIKQRSKNTKNYFMNSNFAYSKNKTNSEITPRSMKIVQNAMVQQANTQLSKFAERQMPSLSQNINEQVRQAQQQKQIEQDKGNSNGLNKTNSKDSLISAGFNHPITSDKVNDSLYQVKSEEKSQYCSNERMVYQQQYQTMSNLVKRPASQQSRRSNKNSQNSVSNLNISKNSKQISAYNSDLSDSMVLQNQGAPKKAGAGAVNKYRSNQSSAMAHQNSAVGPKGTTLNLNIKVSSQNKKPPIKTGIITVPKNNALIRKKSAAPPTDSQSQDGTLLEVMNSATNPNLNSKQTKIAIQMSQILASSPQRKLSAQRKRHFMSPPIKRHSQYATSNMNIPNQVEQEIIQQMINKQFKQRKSMQIEQVPHHHPSRSENFATDKPVTSNTTYATNESKPRMNMSGQMNKKEERSKEPREPTIQNEVLKQIKEQTEIHRRLQKSRKGSMSQLMIQTTGMQKRNSNNSSLHRRNNGRQNADSRSLSKVSRSYMSVGNSSIGRKSSMPRPNFNAVKGIIPKSKDYLIQIFYREFWPIVQRQLRFRSKNEIVQMLSNHDLKDVSGKELEDAFLYNESDFILKNQRHWSESKDMMQISHKSLEYLISSEQAENVMRGLGFLRNPEEQQQQSGKERQHSPLGIDRNIEERIEFIKFWNLLLKVERKSKAQNSPKNFSGSPQHKLFDKLSKRITSTNVKSQSINQGIRGFSPDDYGTHDKLESENGIVLTKQLSSTFNQPQTQIVVSEVNEQPVQVIENDEDIEEEDGEDTGFGEEYLKNELLQSHISNKSRKSKSKSSLILTAEKIRNARNLKEDQPTDDKEHLGDSITKEQSLLGQLLQPCLTTLGDNRDEDEELLFKEQKEQTICIRSFLSTLLELLNIKHSVIRLSMKFPLMFRNRKEYEEKYKKTSEYNFSVQTVRSQREELASQYVERRQLFKQEKEQSIQIKELGYFGTKRHSVNESIKQKKMSDRLIQEGQTNSNYQQFNLFMHSLRNTEMKQNASARNTHQKKSRKSSHSKSRSQTRNKQLTVVTKMLEDYRKKVRQRGSMEQININYKDVYLTPTNAQEMKAPPGTAQAVKRLSPATQLIDATEQDSISLELPIKFRSQQQDVRKMKTVNQKGKSAEPQIEQKKYSSEVHKKQNLKKSQEMYDSTKQAQSFTKRASNKIQKKPSRQILGTRNHGMNPRAQHQRTTNNINNSKNPLKQQSTNELNASSKGTVPLAANCSQKTQSKIASLLDDLPKVRPGKQSPTQINGITIQFTTVRSMREKKNRKAGRLRNELRPERRVSETFDNGLPKLKKEKVIIKRKYNPVIKLDLDELKAKNSKSVSKNASVVNTQRTVDDHQKPGSRMTGKRKTSSSISNDLQDKTYADMAKQRRMISQSRIMSEMLSNRSQRSTTRVKNRSLRTQSQANITGNHSQASSRMLTKSPRMPNQTYELNNEGESIFTTTERQMMTPQDMTVPKIKTRMTTLSEDPEFNVQTTTVKKEKNNQQWQSESQTSLFGSYQHLTEQELDKKIQQVQQEYQEINEMAHNKKQMASQPRQYFVSPPKNIHVGSLKSSTIVSPRGDEEREDGKDETAQNLPGNAPSNNEEVAMHQRPSIPTTIGQISPKDINDQSIGSIKIHYEQLNATATRVKEENKAKMYHANQDKDEDGKNGSKISKDRERLLEESVKQEIEGEEERDSQEDDDENVYFFEPTSSHFQQVQLRQHIKQANKSQQMTRKLPMFNDEVIKETFREDSLASSEEGILASHYTPSNMRHKHDHSKNKYTEEYSSLFKNDQSIALTETGLVDGAEGSRSYQRMKVNQIRRMNTSNSQYSPDNKKSISSDGDISKLKADVLKFMQKQQTSGNLIQDGHLVMNSNSETGEYNSNGVLPIQNMEKQTTAHFKYKTASEQEAHGDQHQPSPTDFQATLERTLNPNQTKHGYHQSSSNLLAIQELPVLFSEKECSPLLSSRDASRNISELEDLALERRKISALTTDPNQQQRAKANMSGKRFASRNSNLNLAKPDHQSYTSEFTAGPDMELKEQYRKLNQDVEDKINQSASRREPTIFQTFAPKSDKKQHDSLIHDIKQHGHQTETQQKEEQQLTVIKGEAVSPQKTDRSEERIRRGQKKRTQPKQNSQGTGSPPAPNDPVMTVNLITQSSADEDHRRPSPMLERPTSTAFGTQNRGKAVGQDRQGKLSIPPSSSRELLVGNFMVDDESVTRQRTIQVAVQIEEQGASTGRQYQQVQIITDRLDTQLDVEDSEAQIVGGGVIDEGLREVNQKLEQDVLSESQKSDIFERSIKNQIINDDASTEGRPQSFTSSNKRMQREKTGKRKNNLRRSGISQKIHQEHDRIIESSLSRDNSRAKMITPRNADSKPVNIQNPSNGKMMTHRSNRNISNSVTNLDDQLRDIIDSEHKLMGDTSSQLHRADQLQAKSSAQLPKQANLRPVALMTNTESMKSFEGLEDKGRSTADRNGVAFDDNSTIFVNATSQLSSKVSSPVGLRQKTLFSAQSSEYSYQSKGLQRFQGGLSSIPEKPLAKVFKFEIHIDKEFGTQVLEIYNKDNVKENIERFALKYGIRSQSKINKLTKRVRKEIKNREIEEEQSFM